MQTKARRWSVALLLLAAGALLRLLFLHWRTEFAGDALIYADLARNMLEHHVYGVTEARGIRPTLIRLPGYPLFLAACFRLFGVGNLVAVLWVQIVVSLAECCLLAKLAARLMGRRAGLIALGLAALCPFTANYTATVLAETCSLFCVTLAFFLLERWTVRQREGAGWALAVGIGAALAGAVLLRPDQALLAAVVVPVMVWVGVFGPGAASSRRRVGPAVVASVVIALPLALWGVRNWRVFHVVQPLAPRYATDPGELISYGFQRWYKTWAIDFKSTEDVYWTYDGSPLLMGDLPPRAFDSAAQRAETERVYAAYNVTMAANKPVDEAFGRLAAERVRSHPLRYYVWLPLAKLANMWLRPRTELTRLPLDWWHWRGALRYSLESVSYAVLNAAYLVLAVLGLARWRRQGWSGQRALGYAMVAFVLLRCALLATIDNSEPRYTLECFPVVILLAAAVVGKERQGSGVRD